MRVLYSLHHNLHHPQREFECSTFQAPFEHPGRAEIIREALAADDRFELAAPDEWGTDPIAQVHDPGLISHLETAWSDFQEAHGPTHDVVPDMFVMAGLRDSMTPGREPVSIDARLGWWAFETTTPITHGTYEAARSAVNVALSTWTAVESGEPIAYGLCRPPGHHATRSLYGGYCFFNNAAVVAHRVATTTGTKVAVLDVDYHHGNGTQQIFYERDDVLVVSLHADPVRAYPYVTGHGDETGSGRGAGANVNLPLAAGLDDDGYLPILESALETVMGFEPSTLVVSLGLDTFDGDPISDLALSAEGFARCGAAIRAAGLPTVVLQEGGYADEQLGENARAWLLGASGEPRPT